MQTAEIRRNVLRVLLEVFAGQGMDETSAAHIDLTEDLGMDSIQFITLVVELEARFEITVPDERLHPEHFQNADRITATIREIRSQHNDSGGRAQ